MACITEAMLENGNRYKQRLEIAYDSQNPHAVDRRRKMSYAECLKEIPQLRSIAILHFQQGWKPVDKIELDELVSIVRIGEADDCFIYARRFYELVAKFHVRGLPLLNSISARELKAEIAKRTGNTTSQIYFNVYKRCSRRKRD
jgi:hypothetical protein